MNSTGPIPMPERRGRLHADLARAWWQRGNPEQTTRALLAAHRQAPGEVRDRPAICAIATSLVERHPRVVGAQQLAAAIGHRRLRPPARSASRGEAPPGGYGPQTNLVRR
ncbi:MAG: hypothetical protein ACRDRU_16985 [Pseudonocardiaceae bacterium]